MEMNDLKPYSSGNSSALIAPPEATSTPAKDHETAGFLSITDKNELVSNIRDIMLDFLQRSELMTALAPLHIPADIESQTLALAEAYELSVSKNQLKKYSIVGLVMAVDSYRHVSPKLQVLIALYTTLAAMLDDGEVLPLKTISTFPQRFFDGLPQLHPVLAGFTKALASLREYYAPFSATIITTNAVEFISAEMLVRDEEQEGRPDVYDMAAGYAEWLRPKNGLGDLYAVLIWPRDQFPQSKTYIQAIPHCSRYICHVNDIFSFYKEVKAGERDNYISQLAVINRQPPFQAVRDLTEQALSIDLRIKEILGDTPERMAWVSFTCGYAGFHIHTPRYRLKEVLSERSDAFSNQGVQYEVI